MNSSAPDRWRRDQKNEGGVTGLRRTLRANELLDSADGVANREDFRGFIVGDLDLKRRLDIQKEVHHRERVGAEIDEGRVQREAALGHVDPLQNEVSYFVGYVVGHETILAYLHNPHRIL